MHPKIDARHGTFNHINGNVYHQYGAPYRDEYTASILQKLQPAYMDASDRAECLPGTRVAIMQRIIDWALDPTNTQNALWVHGLAGMGKSTLSTTVANRLREMGHLGAFLFFSRDVAARSNPSTVIRTLAYQIGSFHAPAGVAISKAIENFPGICVSPLRVQFQKLLVEPLASVNKNAIPGTLVLVIDSLDECGTPKKREGLLEVFTEQMVQLPSYIRMLITSRSEHDICCAFRCRGQFLEHELNIMSGCNSDDIWLYLQHRMARIRSKTMALSPGLQWPSESDIRELAHRASGLFVWASTASDFIDGYDPLKRMNIVLNGAVTSGAMNALDVLYRTAMWSSENWEDGDFVEDFTAIMGLVLVVQHPLSSTAIDHLLGKPRRPCSYTISHLGCLIQQMPTVRPLHPSFADFLTSRSRCGRDIWFFDRNPCKLKLVILCLRRLNQVLRQNMCDLTLSVDPSGESLPEDVEYACIFWIEHLCAIQEGHPSVITYLDVFVNQHLLHWIEAMSILKESRKAIRLLDNLLVWMKGNCHESGILLELVYDASRLARSFAKEIEEHPLLVYFSAIPFTPTRSAIYKRFRDVAAFPTIAGGYAGGYQQTWSPQLIVLAGHQGSVFSVAFSPDGSRVVSGSNDHTVRIWDAKTGAQILPAIGGHKSVLCSVAFSPDGIHIASGSADGIIRVWDGRSGAEACPALRGHKKEVWAVTFTPDGTRIISSSDDKTIRIWDATSGTEVLPALQGHEDSVRSVAVFPDGTRIVSGSDDHTIRIWDMNTGLQVLAPLRGHDGIVRSIAISPDGTRIASGSHDKTIRIWDSISGTEIFPALRGHDDAIQSVAFSPNGLRIASGSCDNTIRIWNSPGTNAPLILRRHSASVESVSFSPDGGSIASGSSDKTVRIWHTRTDSRILRTATGTGHREAVQAIAFSPNGTRVVSGSNDKTIRVWDAKSGAEAIPAINGLEGLIHSVAFSPDGSLIVSGSQDTTVRVWDASSGDLVRLLLGHNDVVRSPAFSADGKQIVSESQDTTIRGKIGSGMEAILPEQYVVHFVASSDRTPILPGSRRSGRIQDGSGVTLPVSTASDHFVHKCIDVVHNRWVVDFVDNRAISFLPCMIDVDVCSAVHGKSLAVGTLGGRVFVMHFPPALFTSWESRVIEGQGRPIVLRNIP